VEEENRLASTSSSGKQLLKWWMCTCTCTRLLTDFCCWSVKLAGLNIEWCVVCMLLTSLYDRPHTYKLLCSLYWLCHSDHTRCHWITGTYVDTVLGWLIEVVVIIITTVRVAVAVSYRHRCHHRHIHYCNITASEHLICHVNTRHICKRGLI